MENVCRVCLHDGTLVSLFNEDNSVKLSDKIMYCASIQIKPGDELPSQICLHCVERLNMSYEFKTLCEHSDLMLRKKICSENFHSNNFISIKKEKPEVSDFQSGVKYEIDEEFSSYSKKNGIETHGKIINESVIVKANIKCELLDKNTHCTKKKNEKRKCNYDNKCAFKRTNGNICETVLDDSRYAASPVEDSRLSYTSDNSDSVAVLNHHDDMKHVINSENDVYKKKIPEKKKRRTKIHGSESNIKKRKKTSKQQKEQCFTCGKVMSSRFRLEMHLRIHTGEKPFTCKYCQKTFTLSQNLKVHERVHTGEKPLLCGTCGKGFAQSAGLVAHMRLHTGETPYKCTLCPMSFRTPGHLQYHIRQHTGEKNFVCKICNRAFITKGDLTQHTKTHTGERRFVCTICGLRMSRSSHLSRHMMTHTGEKPHKCTYCDSSYTQKGDLVRHVKKNHNKNGIILSKHIESTVPAELSLNVKCDDVNMKIPTKHLREEF